MSRLPCEIVIPKKKELLARPEPTDPAEKLLLRDADGKWTRERRASGADVIGWSCYETVAETWVNPKVLQKITKLGLTAPPGPQGVTNVQGSPGANGPTGPSWTSNSYAGAVGQTGPYGPVGLPPEDKVLVSRLIPGNNRQKLEARYAYGEGKTIVVLRPRYEESTSQRRIGEFVDGFMQYGVRFAPSAEDRSPAAQLCHEVLGWSDDPDYGAIAKDGFWQRFLDDVAEADVVAGVLLT